jgi:hypothetical protein
MPRSSRLTPHLPAFPGYSCIAYDNILFRFNSNKGGIAVFSFIPFVNHTAPDLIGDLPANLACPQFTSAEAASHRYKGDANYYFASHCFFIFKNKTLILPKSDV